MTLIEKLEAASGPDRELDAEIKESVGHNWDYGADWGPRGKGIPVAKPYTASIDAAMTLTDGKLATIVIGVVNMAIVGANARYDEADTPAIALCIAALQAKGVE